MSRYRTREEISILIDYAMYRWGHSSGSGVRFWHNLWDAC